MELYSKRKIHLLIPSVYAAFSAILSVILTASKYDHDCTGEDCPICMQIEAAQSFLKTLKFAVINLVLAVCFLFHTQTGLKYAASITYHFSPIELKVRFNS